MFFLRQLVDGFIQSVKNPVVLFLGLLCAVTFALNAGFLIYLATRKSDHGLAKCPRCGRPILCPHCKDE